jgi:hypothetical protein
MQTKYVAQLQHLHALREQMLAQFKESNRLALEQQELTAQKESLARYEEYLKATAQSL